MGGGVFLSLGLQEDGVIAIGMETTGDAGVGWLLDAQALDREGKCDRLVERVWERTPRSKATAGSSASQDRAVSFYRPVRCGWRDGTDLAVFFVGGVLETQLVDEAVGFGEGRDVFGGEEGGESLGRLFNIVLVK